MPQTVLITGGSGFIGQILMKRLAASRVSSLSTLVRHRGRGTAENGRVQEVVGELLDPSSYREVLTTCDTVVHLAAATGRASPTTYRQVNVEGTRVLLDACKSAGVRNFLYVSTIAAGYPDKRYYPYARTKALAESLVRESSLAFTIVRPTVVLGEASPIWTTLRKVASLPVVPLLEGSRPVMIQPVHVDDIVRGIESILSSARFNGEVLELGGPRPLTLREFIELVQTEVRGESDGRIVRVPLLGPIRLMLAAMEPVLRPLMPVTAGQLAIFANDSTAKENSLFLQLRSDMRSLEETVAALVDASGDHGDLRGQPPRPAEARQLSDSTLAKLRAESRIFGAHLVGTASPPYVEDQYVKACRARGLAFDDQFDCFDRASLWLARKGRLFARWADAYCAIFRRSGALRQKLLVLAAILEHVAPTSESFDQTQPRGAVSSALFVFIYGCSSGVALVLGSLILLPVSLICRLTGQRARARVPADQPS